MVATKQFPPVDLNPKEKKGAGSEGGPGLIEPLGGFIFVCNNDTMSEDFERHLFGLPQRYQDSVKAIQPGLPLFLYNYSTRSLHGVFEAASDGGLNLEPDAWENKETRKVGRQASRFPAQVRVRWREQRPPLDEEKFRPLLFHYDGPKFKLELSEAEAENLLKLFGTPSSQKMEEVQDDCGGEWEKVKNKSKVTRAYRPPPSKRSTSPNSPAGRRRSGARHASVPLISLNTSMNGDSFGRGRESRADMAQRWRSDSDSWSGSSTATASSSWASQDEERPKKGHLENEGLIADANGVALTCSEFNNIHSMEKAFDQANDCFENVSDGDCANTEHSTSEVHVSNGGGPPLGLRIPVPPGFVSYSAALKAGMSAADMETCNGTSNSSTAVHDDGNITSTSGSVGNSRASSGCALIANGTPTQADLQGDIKLAPMKQNIDSGSRGKGFHAEGGISSTQILGSSKSIEQGRGEPKDEEVVLEEEGRRLDRGQVWAHSKSTLARLALTEARNGLAVGARDSPQLNGKASIGDSCVQSKKVLKDGSRNILMEGESADTSITGHQARETVLDDKFRNETTEAVTKKAWQGNDVAVLGRLHDTDPAVSSNCSMNDSSVGHRLSPRSDLIKETTDIVVKTMASHLPVTSPAVVERVPFVQSSVPEGQQNHWPVDKFSGPPPPSVVFPSPHVKPYPQVSTLPPSRPVHESRRSQQYDHLKHEKHVDDRMHFHKQQMPAPEQAPTVLHSQQQRQLGQGLMLLRIPTPPVTPVHQHHHPPILSPALPTPHYRDRSHARNRSGAASVDGGSYGMAYRPISSGPPDGDMGIQSPVLQGVPSPMISVQPILFPLSGNGTFPLPPNDLLGNVEALHAEILEYACMARPSADARICAEAAVDCVREGVKRLWPSADVEVFGSFATGLCLPHSDVDVVVVDSPPLPDTPETATLFGSRALAPLVRVLGAALKEYEWCVSLSTIETASMPVIKLRCRPSTIAAEILSSSPSPAVAIDITIGGRKKGNLGGAQTTQGTEGAGNNTQLSAKFEAATKFHNGVAAREYVIEKLRDFSALAPLVLLLKSYLHHRGLNDVYSGGLGSFSLTLMLVFYLERAPLSCGTPQKVTPQEAPSAPSPTSFTSSAPLIQPFVSTSLSAPSSKRTDSLDSFDDNSSCSSASTDTALSSISTSTSTASSSEDSLLHGGLSVVEDGSARLQSGSGEPLVRRAGGIVEELLGSMHSVQSPNLGTLLIGFLQIFGMEIDFSHVRLVLKGRNGSGGGGLFWNEKIQRPVALWIDDPLRPGANIGAGSFAMFHVQVAWQDMLQLLTRSSGSPGPVLALERVGKGPGRRRPLPLLDQLFFNGSNAPANS